MKKSIKFNRNLFTLSFLFIAFAFTSCEKDEMQDELQLDKRFSLASVTLTVPAEICAGEAAYFCINAPLGTNLQVQQQINGDWIQVYQTSQSTSSPQCFSLTFATEGTYSLRYKAGSGGFSIPVAVQVGNCAACVNNLTADLTCGTTRTLSLSFTAEEAGPIVIQGGLTNGTNIVSATSNVLNRNTTHPSVINSNANVTRWEGNVTACQEVTITIEFTGGNGVGDWSAKRGEDVLSATEEISCI